MTTKTQQEEVDRLKREAKDAVRLAGISSILMVLMIFVGIAVAVMQAISMSVNFYHIEKTRCTASGELEALIMYPDNVQTWQKTSLDVCEVWSKRREE